MPTIQSENAPLGPDEIGSMTIAYKKVLRVLGRTRRDPLAEVIAKKIIEVVQAGEQDSDRIVERALFELGVLTGPKERKRA
jgi:hypothetical protein